MKLKEIKINRTKKKYINYKIPTKKKYINKINEI